MALRGFEPLDDYSRDLEKNHEEANALCESFFITVTKFFREPAVFDEMTKKVFPTLVKNRGREDPIRIWVPGCSTGEEAYSIAICLMEFLGDRAADREIQIFATDIDAGAIARARQASYPRSIERQVSPQRLQRFFWPSDHGYQLQRAIR